MRTSNIVHTTESITERKKHVRDVQENWRSLWYHYTANGLIIQIQGAFIVTPRTVTTQIIVVITWFPLRICLWKSLFRFMSRHSVNKSHNTQSLNQSLTKHLLYFSTQCFFFALFVFVILRFFSLCGIHVYVLLLLLSHSDTFHIQIFSFAWFFYFQFEFVVFFHITDKKNTQRCEDVK